MNTSLQSRFTTLRSTRVFTDVRELSAIFLSLAPYAVAVNQLLVPHNIVGGGLTGLCEIIFFATRNILPPGSLGGLIGANGGIPIWLSTVVINSLLLVVAIYQVGWKFCLRTIWGVFTLAFWLRTVPIAAKPLLSDPFMSCIVAGIFCGLGLGFVFLNNGSSGGTDIVAMIVNKHRHVAIGQTLFLCDLVVISSAYFLPNIQSIEPIVMGLCFTLMCTVALDTMMGRVRQSVQFFIFSKYKASEIADAINQRAHRGVTMLNGTSWYSKRPIQVVTVLAKRYESKKIFDLIKEIDPNAFVSQTEALGVYGKGFDTVLNEQEQARARQLELEFAAANDSAHQSLNEQ